MFGVSLSRGRAALFAALAAAWVGGAARTAHAQAAWPLVYEGRIFDERGRPLEAPVTLTFRLYDAPDGGEPLWAETLPDVVVAAGDFAVALGEVEPLPNDLAPELSLYLGLEVDGDAEQRPRTPIGAALRARFADLAERARRVTGGVVDATELRVGGRLVVDGDGQWVGGAAGLHGPAGLACWDLDADRVADPNEDLNGDGRLTAVDCRGGGAAGGDTLTALACGVGDMVVRTAAGWACDPHANDPDAHHSAISAGLDIAPNSVTLPGNTALSEGALRLGPQNDQVLSAAALATLTGGPGMNADQLHSHAGQGAGQGPRFLGLTQLAYTGDLRGPIGADQKCQIDFPNSHICGYCEFFFSRPNAPLRADSWIEPPPSIVSVGAGSPVSVGVCREAEPRGLTVSYSINVACGGYTSENPNDFTGSIVSTGGAHYGNLGFNQSGPTRCSERKPIACCAN